MQFSLSFAFILFSISFTVGSPDSYDTFGFDNLEDPVFSDVSDYSNSALDPWSVSNGADVFKLDSDDDTNLDMFSQISEGDSNTDLFAAGCSMNDRLGARDGAKCGNPADQLKVPEFPTLDRLEQIAPPSTQQNQGTDRSEDTSLTGTNKNGLCPPLTPIHLCCLCEAQFQFYYCQDCLPSESFSLLNAHPFQHSDCKRLLKDLQRQFFFFRNLFSFLFHYSSHHSTKITNTITRSGDSRNLLLAPRGSMLSKIWSKSRSELSIPFSTFLPSSFSLLFPCVFPKNETPLYTSIQKSYRETEIIFSNSFSPACRIQKPA